MKHQSVRLAKQLVQPVVLAIALVTASGAVAEERDPEAIIKANFKAADSDGNGSLNPTEFKALIDANAESEIGRAAMIKRFGAYDRAFNTADQDRDGSVAWSEIARNLPQED
ncbi:MAG: hypothetical protein CMQ05_08510 [Gammaproteobacteria bacterium]|nr:hypothetical protein [Gammaproteobacteria bacterium]RPG24400.1 MAG: EF-hand domain-containing protein [Gammaproteobacteria bacterium TMED50]|tara:strand:+ start:567 stop:902 length:336 start_codon:yes stop_codon:yes gene_type:complete